MAFSRPGAAQWPGSAPPINIVELRFSIAVAVLLELVTRRDGFEILRRALRLEVAHDLLDLVVGHEWAVHAADAAAARHVQHVALAEQLLGALLAQDGAAVDLGSDLERDAR